MANTETPNLMDLLDVALGLAKDKAFADALLSVQAAQREYLMAEADERRAQSKAAIRQMVKLDAAAERLKREYARLSPSLTPDARAHFNRLFESLSRQRARLVQKKKSLSSAFGAASVKP